MSCKHPLKAFNLGLNEKTGKKLIKVTSYNVNHIEKVGDSLIPVEGEFVSDQASKVYFDWQEIPCGQCMSCRIDYSRQWANRCLLEMQYHKSTMFVTLTYNDENLPTDILDVAPDTGETNIPIHSLVLKDLQNFFKDLRYHYKDKLRYFACGEYGDKGRPHYHCIIFGLELDDLKMYKRVVQNGQVYWYYTSPLLDSIWNKGFVIVAPASWESIAYTARYVTKKLKGQAAQFYEDYHLKPEFVVMSRKPGIANQYFIDHPDMFGKDLIRVPTLTGLKEFGIPRYFKTMFDSLDHEAYNHYRDLNVTQAEISKSIKMSKTSLSYLEALEVEEEVLKDKLMRLRRDKV